MTSALIRAIIGSINVDGIDCLVNLDKSIESGSMTVRYWKDVHGLNYRAVFESTDSGKDISFACGACQIILADVEKEFGAVVVRYNFRENYSKFTINISSARVQELYFVKDNRFDIGVLGQVVETTPQGEATYHAGLVFSEFCLRLRP